MDFPGVALVIGAASGIGKATAVQYAADGCQRIAIADLNFKSLQHVEQQMKQDYETAIILAVQVDVRDQASVNALVQEVVKVFGRIDYCANVAGIMKFGDTVHLSEEDFTLIYEINLRGMFFCAKAEITQMLTQEPLAAKYVHIQDHYTHNVAPQLILPILLSEAVTTNAFLLRDSLFPARGAICNVSSQAGLMGNGNLPSYVAMKHGVIGLSKSDGQKYASMGIRVNALCPGSIETPMLVAMPEKDVERRAEERKNEIAVGRVGLPEEMAYCIMFLTSGRSSFVTATTLAAHGGIRNQ